MLKIWLLCISSKAEHLPPTYITLEVNESLLRIFFFAMENNQLVNIGQVGATSVVKYTN